MTQQDKSGSKKQDQIRHHTYDGIKEYDNSLPRWWVWLFNITIVFGVVYYGYYHFGGGRSLKQALTDDMSAAKATAGAPAAVSGEDLAVKLRDPGRIAAGKELFAVNCLGCHGAAGEGTVGPNLTDKAWIHGGSADKILATVSDGVPAKGMPAWKPTLGAEKVEALTAFVLSIKGTNVAGKEPQGTEEP